MLTRLSKTLGTNTAIAGLSLLVLGAGGATTLTASSAPSPSPSETRADIAKQKQADRQARAEIRAAEAADVTSESTGSRPTDTHGYCVSQVAKNAPTEVSGEGADKVNHGTIVRAAAQACGNEESTPSAEEQKTNGMDNGMDNGKAHGKHHGTGMPAGMPASEPAPTP